MPELPENLEDALAERYAIERVAGRGGMATVYLARDLRHQRRVAVKVLDPALSASLGRDRFLQEIAIAAQLRHPHILPLYDSGAAGDVLYYVMPYLEGESLRDRLQREPRLPLAEARRVAREVADALAYAHAQGVVHRDVKPENILLESGHAVVADFGIARAVHSAGGNTLTAAGTVLGTPAYMSPEQASGEESLDGRSDIYSLGCVLYEMLAGAPPFAGPTAQAVIAAHLTQAPPALREIRPEVPAALAALVARTLAKDPAARLPSAAELRDALAGSEKAPPRGGSRRSRFIIAAGVLGLAAVALALALIRPRPPALDTDLVAVAPFSALDGRLALWREGLVDLVSRNLDGAGPLRTVPPTTVIRRWSGQDDKASAGRLAQVTGARMIVFGNLLATGGDSARLVAEVYDAARGVTLADLDLRDDLTRVDRLADSLTLGVLRALGQARGLEAFRSTSASFHSLAALKAFLQGEQWFRRTGWDSALVAFQRAAALDSTSPLPLNRLSTVLGWTRSAQDSLSQALAERAGALNHGLPPRDSLIVAFDSVFAGVSKEVPLARWADVRRLHELALALTTRYPTDAESWYDLGEAVQHYGDLFGAREEDDLRAFDRAIALDSSFAPAYIHAIADAYAYHGPAAALVYARDYLRLGPTDGYAAAMSLVAGLLDPATSRNGGADRQLSALPSSGVPAAFMTLVRGADTAAWDLALARRLVQTAPTDPGVRLQQALSKLYHGELATGSQEFVAYGGAQEPSQILVDAALLNPVAPALDSALARWFSAPLPVRALAVAGLPVWAARRDTTFILRTLQVLEHPADFPEGPWRDLARYGTSAAQAYLSLVRGDTTEAIRRLAALPDTLLPIDYYPRLTLASLYSARHDDRHAAALLARRLTGALPTPSMVLWRLLRARTEERLGKPREAVRDYGYVADVWRHADHALQPYVAEAAEGVRRLSHEGSGS